jgi:hypothetical protein
MAVVDFFIVDPRLNQTFQGVSMIILIIAAVALFLGMLVAFALLLGGYWETPEQIKQQILAFARKQPDPSVKFRAWAASDLGENPPLQAWLASLPEAGFQALTQRVVKFCADLNIQLSWLVERHVDVAPPLRLATKTIVADYLEVCWQAIRHQGDISLFGKYHKLVANPADARYRDLRRQVFTRLTALGLAEPLPTYELIMASELQRQVLAADAIREAAAKDWDAFAKIFAELLESGEEKPPAAQAA